MARIVMLQISTAAMLALVWMVLSGTHAGLSALFGGLCAALPNALFALRLASRLRRPDTIDPMHFFVGELIKISLTIVLLFAVVYGYRDVNWLALLVAFILVLKSYFILLFTHSP